MIVSSSYYCTTVIINLPSIFHLHLHLQPFACLSPLYCFHRSFGFLHIMAHRRLLRASTRLTTSSTPTSAHLQPHTSIPTSTILSHAAAPLPLNIQPHVQNSTSLSARRSYYTKYSPAQAPYPQVETAILSAALEHVPTLGFTNQAITQGAIDAGYLPASINLFPKAAFDLVLYYLVTQRLALKHLVQFPTTSSTKPLGTGAKVRALLLARLRANEPLVHKYAEALALISLAGNIPASTAELARLADEIWYLAGDVSVDSSWYTKRGLLAGVYASAEVFMTQDRSFGFVETEKFVDRRLDEVRRVGGAVGAVGEWMGYTAISAVNVARSFGWKV